jgi:hypothetical protein
MTTAGTVNPAYRGMEVDEENFPRYKAGANYSDTSKIKKYSAAGYDTNQIAHMLGIHEKCIISHVRGPRKKPGPKPKQVEINE